MRVGPRCDARRVTPWLPLISSLVVASVALVGIRINNRTNQDAIAAANEREYRKWLRETVLKQCCEAIDTALSASDSFHDWYLSSDGTDVSPYDAAVFGYARKLSANAATLEILNAPTIAAQCNQIQDTLIYVLEALEADDLEKLQEGQSHLTHDRVELTQLANAELHKLGHPASDQPIKPNRVRFRRALRADE